MYFGSCLTRSHTMHSCTIYFPWFKKQIHAIFLPGRRGFPTSVQQFAQTLSCNFKVKLAINSISRFSLHSSAHIINW